MQCLSWYLECFSPISISSYHKFNVTKFLILLKTILVTRKGTHWSLKYKTKIFYLYSFWCYFRTMFLTWGNRFDKKQKVFINLELIDYIKFNNGKESRIITSPKDRRDQSPQEVKSQPTRWCLGGNYSIKSKELAYSTQFSNLRTLLSTLATSHTDFSNNNSNSISHNMEKSWVLNWPEPERLPDPKDTHSFNSSMPKSLMSLPIPWTVTCLWARSWHPKSFPQTWRTLSHTLQASSTSSSTGKEFSSDKRTK